MKGFFGNLKAQIQEEVERRVPTAPQLPPREAQPQAQPAPKPSGCLGRKAVLVHYNQFYVFKHSVLPRLDPESQDLRFAVCKSCFRTEISRHPDFPSSFEPFESPDRLEPGQELLIPSTRCICDFWLPIVKQTFYTQCLPRSNLQHLVAVAQHIQDLPPCPEDALWAGGEVFISPSIPNGTICARCFELYLSLSPFKDHFTKHLQGAEDQWTCDIGQDPGYIHNIVIDVLTHRQHQPAAFNELAEAINRRINLPPCPGEGKAIQRKDDGQVHAYGATDGPGRFCEECTYDRIKFTSLEELLTPVVLNGRESINVTCDLASSMSRFLLSTALEANDMSRWREAIMVSDTIPKCEGIKGVGEEVVKQQIENFGPTATWYHVNEQPTIEVCPNCFLCIVRPLGGEHLFTPISRPLMAGVVRMCNFWIGTGGVSSSDPNDFPSTLQYRGFMFRHILSIGWESQKQDFAPFMLLTKMMASCGPPCGAGSRGFKKPNGRKWYGHITANENDPDDCSIVLCEECYDDMKDTSLGTLLGTDLSEAVYQNSDPQKEVFCGPWSKISKEVLKQAAEAQDFTLFARHWRNRELVAAQTLPLIQAYRNQYNTQSMLKMSAYMNATTVQSGAGVLEAVSGGEGHKYGNSVVGYGFDSRPGAEAAIMRRDADNMSGGDMGLLMKAAQLEMQWKAVE